MTFCTKSGYQLHNQAQHIITYVAYDKKYEKIKIYNGFSQVDILIVINIEKNLKYIMLSYKFCTNTVEKKGFLRYTKLKF